MRIREKYMGKLAGKIALPANTAKSFHQHSERSSVSGRGGQVLEIGPIDGPGMEKMMNGLYEFEPAVLSRVKQILESK
jgi:hypothetical protein